MPEQGVHHERKTKLVTLDNGAVIVSRKFPESNTTHLQWSVTGGSYAEEPHEYGVAHFLEHTLVDLARIYRPVRIRAAL